MPVSTDMGRDYLHLPFEDAHALDSDHLPSNGDSLPTTKDGDDNHSVLTEATADETIESDSLHEWSEEEDDPEALEGECNSCEEDQPCEAMPRSTLPPEDAPNGP